MTPLSLTLYRWGTGLLSPMAPRLLRQRAERGKEDPDRLRERLGYADALRPDGPLIWLHGASVGESLSLLALIEGLRTQRPGVAVLVTSGTVTSAELMARRLPKGVIHQYAPVDTPGAARRFVQHWKPQLTVFVESEIWPNLILAAKAGGSKLALLSARVLTEEPAQLAPSAGRRPHPLRRLRSRPGAGPRHQRRPCIASAPATTAA